MSILREIVINTKAKLEERRSLSHWMILKKKLMNQV